MSGSPPGEVAPPEIRPLSGRLEAIDGYDLAAGLRNVGGQLPTLSRVLREFVRNYRAGEPAFLSPNTHDAVQRWNDQCHSMRGACATIGATRLQAQLAEFELALAASGDAPALVSRAQQLSADLVALAGRLGEELER